VKSRQRRHWPGRGGDQPDQVDPAAGAGLAELALQV